MADNRRKIGTDKEDLAAEFLKKKGFHILERNFYCRQGEIDIIAESPEEVLVFFEVKYRKNDQYGWPEEAVNSKKQIKIQKAAKVYLYQNRFFRHTRCRFDVISILGNEILQIENAFGCW